MPAEGPIALPDVALQSLAELLKLAYSGGHLSHLDGHQLPHAPAMFPAPVVDMPDQLLNLFQAEADALGTQRSLERIA